MPDHILLTIAASLVATLFGLLIAVLGWLGNKIYTKMEEIVSSLNKVQADLHERITGIDKRLTVVETRCNSNH